MSADASKLLARNKRPIPCKMILVGESGVGKTSIISRYIKNLYNDNQTSTLSPLNIKKNIIIDGYNLELEIWDTAGQEKYRSITSLFYKDALICILVYDITKKNTFEKMQQYWHFSVTENGVKGIILGVAGNKSDLYENEQVTEKEAKEYCDYIKAPFQLVSAKNNSCINELFNDLLTKFIESEFMKKMIPEYISEEDNKLWEKRKIKLENSGDDQEIDDDKKKKKKKCC
jgi:small GTP-binding protein